MLEDYIGVPYAETEYVKMRAHLKITIGLHMVCLIYSLSALAISCMGPIIF